MISYAEQELLESIVKNTSRSLQDIYTVLGKVYDDELALDLNIQAAGYSGIKEKAANCLFETGNVPPLLGVMERAKRWGMLQAKTALNVNTGYMANMLAKEERLRRSDMQKATQKLEICGKESETIAREFLNLEEKNIRILQNYCRKKEKKSAKNVADARQNEGAVGGRERLAHHVNLARHRVGIGLGNVGLRECVVDFSENGRSGKKTGRKLFRDFDAIGPARDGRFNRSRQQSGNETLDLSDFKKPQTGDGRLAYFDFSVVKRNAHFALAERMQQKSGALRIDSAKVVDPVGRLLRFEGLHLRMYKNWPDF